MQYELNIPGELIEKGVMRRLPYGFDGNTCEYIFTWSEERPCKVSTLKYIYSISIMLQPRDFSSYSYDLYKLS